jgi:UDP-glucose 4-epimerase
MIRMSPNKAKPKNIVVTGGAGFIGTNLIMALKKQGHKIVSIDNYSSGKKSNHQEGVEYLVGQTSDIFSILDGRQVDAVFHLGEHSKIVPSFTEIYEVWKSNSEGTFNVLEFCKKRKVKLVYAGSSTRFAKEGEGHSPYSFTKAKNCDLIRYYSNWYGLSYAICYFYNVFGPYQDTCDNGYETVVSIFEKQYRQGLPLTVTGTGEQKRSFTYVKDIVDGLIRALGYSKNDEFQLNHKKQYTILEIAKMFSDKIKFIPARPGDRSESVSDTSKSRKLLGWDTTFDVSHWIKERKELYESLHENPTRNRDLSA